MSFKRWCCVVVALFVIALPAIGQSSKTQYIKQQLVFEPNHGQSDSATRFLSHSKGHSVLFRETEVVFAFTDPASTFRMNLVGQNPNPKIEGLDRESSVSNYFIGDDPSAWRSSVPQFARVKYGSVYPGIDLVYYGSERQLEYDFVVSPRVNPSVVQMEFPGANNLSISPEGDLVLQTGGGEVRHQRPVAYQIRGGTREAVEASFVVEKGRASFALGAYDHSLPLVIDPKFVWATYVGGPGDDQANDISVDAAGNAYLTGAVESIAGVTTGVLNGQAGKAFQIFVTKVNPAGAIVYTAYVGGSSNEEGHSIGLDPDGNVYVTGFTTSTDFPLVNAAQTKLGGAQDGYVFKLNKEGTALLFSTYIGGAQLDRSYGIAVDPAGNSYVAGNTLSSDFPVKNAFQSKKGGGLGDAFLAKYGPSGILAFSTYFGGSGNDQAYDVARDDDGNVIVTGFTTSQNFPTQKAIYSKFRGGGDDIFISKFNESGSALVFSTYFGGSGSDNGVRLTVDKDKNIYVTGYTSSLDFPIKNAPQGLFGGIADLSTVTYDAFLVKMHPDGQDADFSTYIGGEDTESGVGVAVDKNGFIYLVGYTNSLQFYAINSVGGFLRGLRDGFVMKLSSDASVIVYSSYLGGFGAEGATGVAVDDAGNAYVVGYTSSLDLPLATDTMFQGAIAGGSQDGFLFKINSDDIKTSTSFTFNPGGGSSVFTAGQTSSPVFGYAAVDVASGLSPAGLEIVDLRSSGVLVNEVGIPAPELLIAGRLFVRTTAGDTTALTIANPSNEDIDVKFYVTAGADASTVMHGHFTMPAKVQASALLTDSPFGLPAELEGTMTFNTSAPVAATALQVTTGGINPINVYVPIYNPDAAQKNAIVLPDFVDGAGWTTQLTLVNPTEYAINGEVRLFKNTTEGQAGVPAEVSTERGVGSVFSYSIPPRGHYRLLTRGEAGETTVGHADIVPLDNSFAPFGFGVITLSSDFLLQTTVEATEPGFSFRAYVESTGKFPEDLAARPAVAISNSTDFSAPVTLTLSGFDGTPSGLSATVIVPPKTTLGKFLTEIPGFENLPSPYYGILKATTTNVGVNFAGFRARYNEQRHLLLLATTLKNLGNNTQVIFPHLVDGGGYASQFVVISGSAGGGASGAISYRDQVGKPLNLAIAP
jgi:hypothetical protein